VQHINIIKHKHGALEAQSGNNRTAESNMFAMEDGNRETWPHWRKEMGKCPKEIEFLSRIKP
jgi:hypothetical protein